MIVVSDTTAITTLLKTGDADLLAKLFGVVLIPPAVSDELRAFHRRELKRQMDLGCRVFVYWSVPAVLLILYGLAAAVPGFRGGVMLLGALAMQICVIAWVHWKERSRYQRELDRLDEEAGQA